MEFLFSGKNKLRLRPALRQDAAIPVELLAKTLFDLDLYTW